MASRNDVEVAEPGATEDGLLAEALRGKAMPGRVAALKELLRRRSPRVRPVLGKIATDPGAPPELRTTALVALGREASPESEQALTQSLGSDDRSVVTAAAESLARVGGRRGFDALSKMGTTAPPGAIRSVEAARILLSYRLGLGTERLPEPPAGSRLEVDPERAETLRMEPVGPEAFEAARRSLQEELPAIGVTERGSVRFTCGGERLWLVLTEKGVAGGEVDIRNDMVAAVVLKESHCPDRWYVREYVLAHPRDGGAAVFGVRPNGRVVHFGELLDEGNTPTLHLRAVDTPGTPALELRAAVGPEGTIVISEGLVGPPRRRKTAPGLPGRTPSRPVVTE